MFFFARGPPAGKHSLLKSLSGILKIGSLIFLLIGWLCFNSCGRKVKLSEGSLEGKVVLVERSEKLSESHLSPPFYPQALTEEVKVCAGKDAVDPFCLNSTSPDSEGRFKFERLGEGRYSILFDASGDGIYEGLDNTSVEAGRTTYVGKKEIERKEAKDFNCLIALDKQNYCSGENMVITLQGFHRL